MNFSKIDVCVCVCVVKRQTMPLISALVHLSNPYLHALLLFFGWLLSYCHQVQALVLKEMTAIGENDIIVSYWGGIKF